ncbi:AraC family ligand binding domain-containing protein [Candidatus Symbiopectobacterium endolongispinus]|nr:AraC family ligand binding domain-containing protein [Candidatus Symbiopectobacterium endolongispinus]
MFHFWHPEKSISHEHTHEYCELFLVSKGSGIHVINEKPYLLTAGTLCYLNRQDYHLFDEMKNLCQVNLLYLGRDSFNCIKRIDHLLPQQDESNVWQVDTRVMQQVFDRLASHHEEAFEDKLLAESHKEMIFLEVLHTLNHWRYKTQDFHSSDDRISQILIRLKASGRIRWTWMRCVRSLVLRAEPCSVGLPNIPVFRHSIIWRAYGYCRRAICYGFPI